MILEQTQGTKGIGFANIRRMKVPTRGNNKCKGSEVVWGVFDEPKKGSEKKGYKQQQVKLGLGVVCSSQRPLKAFVRASASTLSKLQTHRRTQRDDLI